MQFIDDYDVDVAFDVTLAGARGCHLSANMYRPAANDVPSLTVLIWTPYDNGRLPRPDASLAAPYWSSRQCKRLAAAANATVVCIDVRGRGDSEGSFRPFIDEAADAAEVVRSIRSHPWCQGQLVVMGKGYGAICALAAVQAAPQEIASALLVSPPGRAWDVFPGRDGVRRADLLLWRHLIAGRTPQPVELTDWASILTKPWCEQESLLGRDDLDWLGFGSDADICEALDDSRLPTQVPVMLVTGWWDPACRAAWTMAQTGSARLMVGPWGASAARRPAQNVGAMDWGPASVADPLELQLDWLTSTRNGDLGQRHRLFVTGTNTWLTFSEIPEPTPWELHLASTGPPLTTAGGGVLTVSPGDGSDRFESRLSQPVPAQPSLAAAVAATSPAVLDMTFLDGRHDVAVYTSAPLLEPCTVLGEVTLRLNAQSDSPEPALWVASLEDVFPGGTRSVHLALGVVEARCGQPPEPLRLGPVGHRFLPGHRVRLRVAGTCAPLFRPLDGTPERDLREIRHHGSLLSLPALMTP